jgi:hypothetical protein
LKTKDHQSAPIAPRDKPQSAPPTVLNALPSNTVGGNNTASGFDALQVNTAGGANTASGAYALQKNTVGNGSTAVGYWALKLATGDHNTALGTGALLNSTGVYNIAVGVSAGSAVTTGGFNILIGHQGTSGDSGVTRIGTSQTQAFIAGIDGVTSSGGTGVFVNGAGQLGTTTSSLRFKEDVTDMGEASADLLRLRPVTFHYKPAYDDGSHLLQYGLIAEEVAEVYPDLVQYDAEGRPRAVRYHFVNAMLLNEVQRQYRKIAELQAQVGPLDHLRDQIRELAALQARVTQQDAQLAEQRAELALQEARLKRLEAKP